MNKIILDAFLRDLKIPETQMSDDGKLLRLLSPKGKVLAMYRGEHLGESSTEPTTRQDGKPLQEGDRYYDTVGNGEKVFDGVVWYNPTLEASAELLAARDVAVSAATTTVTARDASLLARDVAQAHANIYPTIASGRAAVADGQFFSVQAGGTDALTRVTVYRRDSSTTQTVITTFLPASDFDAARNEVKLYFTDKIKVDRTTGYVTYPAGLAMRNGIVFKNFNATTLAASNGLTAYYHYFDFDALLQATPGDPFKMTSGGSPIPVPDPDYVTLGLSYGGIFHSPYGFEYAGASRVHFRLPNECINGNFYNLGEGLVLYGGVARPTSTDAAPIIAINNTALNALNCFAGIQLDPAKVYTGNFIDIDVSDRGHENAEYIYTSMLVHSSNGTWDFNSASSPIVYLVHGVTGVGTENNGQQFALSSFDDLGNNIRRYYRTIPITAPGAGKYLKLIRAGMRIGSAASAIFTFTGIWASISSNSYRAGNKMITLEDTAWPSWNNLSAAAIGALRRNQQSLDRRVKALEAPSQGAIKKLVAALMDPLHSVYIRLMGDSITWGSGATANSTSTPRNHALADPRNNLDAATWANLLRKYLGRIYADSSTPIEDAPGSGYFAKTHTLDPTILSDKRFRYIHPVTKYPFVPGIQTRTGPYFGRCVDLEASENYNGYLEFDMVGDNLAFLFSSQFYANEEANSIADVYGNDVLLGSFNYYSAVATWNQVSPTLTFPFGKYKISVRNRSNLNCLRLEGVRVTQKIKVANDGISGTNTSEWLPGTALYTGSVQPTDEFVFVQLGTNDRGGSTIPKNVVKTRENLRAIASDLRTVKAKEVILMAANASTTEDPATYFYTQGDVARETVSLGKELGIDVIDHFTPTSQALAEGQVILADGLHPNDAGYFLMFKNIIRLLEAARTMLI